FPDMVKAEMRFTNRLVQQNLNQNILLNPTDNDSGEDKEALMDSDKGIDSDEIDSDETDNEEISSE
ncbi:9449_t:CDS:1, partial [Racocetra fulgida]